MFQVYNFITKKYYKGTDVWTFYKREGFKFESLGAAERVVQGLPAEGDYLILALSKWGDINAITYDAGSTG